MVATEPTSSSHYPFQELFLAMPPVLEDRHLAYCRDTVSRPLALLCQGTWYRWLLVPTDQPAGKWTGLVPIHRQSVYSSSRDAVHPQLKDQNRKISIKPGISQDQLMDNSLLNFAKDLSQIGQKTYAQIWVCASFLAHNLTKCHNFWKKTILFDLYHWILFYLQFIAQYMLKRLIYVQNGQIGLSRFLVFDKSPPLKISRHTIEPNFALNLLTVWGNSKPSARIFNFQKIKTIWP